MKQRIKNWNKWIIISVQLAIGSGLFASNESQSRVDAVFAIVKEKFPLIAEKLQVKVEQDNTARANTQCASHQIKISTGLLNKLTEIDDTDSALLFVLGHEVGHQFLCGSTDTRTQSAHDQEYFADFFASIVVRSENRSDGSRLALEAIEKLDELKSWTFEATSGQGIRGANSLSHPTAAQRRTELAKIWNDKQGSFAKFYEEYDQARRELTVFDPSRVAQAAQALSELHKRISAYPHNGGNIAAVSMLNLTIANAYLKAAVLEAAGIACAPFVPILTISPLFSKAKSNKKGVGQCESKERTLKKYVSASSDALNDFLKTHPDDSSALITRGLVRAIQVNDLHNVGSIEDRKKALEILDKLIETRATPEHRVNRAIIKSSFCEVAGEFDQCSDGIKSQIKTDLEFSTQVTAPSLGKTAHFNLARYYELFEKNSEKKTKHTTVYKEMCACDIASDYLLQLLEQPNRKNDFEAHVEDLIPREWMDKSIDDVLKPIAKSGLTVIPEPGAAKYFVQRKKGEKHLIFYINAKTRIVTAIEIYPSSGYQFKKVILGKSTYTELYAAGYCGQNGTVSNTDYTVSWGFNPGDNVANKFRIEKNK